MSVTSLIENELLLTRDFSFLRPAGTSCFENKGEGLSPGLKYSQLCYFLFFNLPLYVDTYIDNILKHNETEKR